PRRGSRPSGAADVRQRHGGLARIRAHRRVRYSRTNRRPACGERRPPVRRCPWRAVGAVATRRPHSRRGWEHDGARTQDHRAVRLGAVLDRRADAACKECQMTWYRSVLFATVLAALAGGACSRSRAAASDVADVPTVAVAKAVRGDIAQSLTIAAEFRP